MTVIESIESQAGFYGLVREEGEGDESLHSRVIAERRKIGLGFRLPLCGECMAEYGMDVPATYECAHKYVTIRCCDDHKMSCCSPIK